MRIDDALFYVSLDESVAVDDLEDWCSSAVAGGVDVVECRSGDELARISGVCRREEIIAATALDGTAVEVEADAVVINAGEMSVGLARGMVQPGVLTGVRAATLNDIILAVETDCDFVVYTGGHDAHQVFAAVMRPGVPLFAGGMRCLDDIEAVIAAGVFRIAVPAALLGDNSTVRDNAAKISRLLGREI